MADDNAIRIDSTKAAVTGDAADTDELHRLGYPQMLNRGLTGFRNMGVAFSIICVIGGVSIMYSTGMNDGGPVDLFWGWILVSGLNLGGVLDQLSRGVEDQRITALQNCDGGERFQLMRELFET